MEKELVLAQPSGKPNRDALVTPDGSPTVTGVAPEHEPIAAATSVVPRPASPVLRDSVLTGLPTVVTGRDGLGLVVRALWFIFIGWWATGVLLVGAYLLSLTIILLPLAFVLFNAVPVVLTLRSRSHHVVAEVRDGVLYIDHGNVPQRSFLLRAVWFVLVGWWFSALCIAIGYALCLTVVLIPIGVMVLNRIPESMTLRRT